MKQIGGGLIPPKQEDKKFSFGAVFGYGDPKELPATFRFTPLEIKDQHESDLCLAFTYAEAREIQEGRLISPEYLFKNIKKKEGDWRTFGADPKTGANALLQGLLPKELNPFPLGVFDRDFIANWGHWTENIDKQADIFTDSFFWVGETGDKWDAIRLALWRFKDERRPIATGGIWRASWTSSTTIPLTYEVNGTPHAFLVIGWENDNLILQLSNGSDIGDKGIFYMPKEVARKELWFAIMFKDMPAGETKTTVLEKSVKYRLVKRDGRFAVWLRSWWSSIKAFFGFSDKTFGALRSPKWRQIQKEHIKKFPTCAATGKKGTLLNPLSVHHVKPFHLYPELELDPNNLITLSFWAHLWLAHLGNYKSFNLNIREDAATLLAKIISRP